jgi:hypothetical protein
MFKTDERGFGLRDILKFQGEKRTKCFRHHWQGQMATRNTHLYFSEGVWSGWTDNMPDKNAHAPHIAIMFIWRGGCLTTKNMKHIKWVIKIIFSLDSLGACNDNLVRTAYFMCGKCFPSYMEQRLSNPPDNPTASGSIWMYTILCLASFFVVGTYF